MLDGEPDSKKLADVCRGRLREKIPERELALEGRRTSHHRWMLRLQREQLEFLERQIEELDIRIQDHIPVTSWPSIYASPLPESKGRPANWIAQIGIDMDPFPRPSIRQVGPACVPGTTRVPASD